MERYDERPYRSPAVFLVSTSDYPMLMSATHAFVPGPAVSRPGWPEVRPDPVRPVARVACSMPNYCKWRRGQGLLVGECESCGGRV